MTSADLADFTSNYLSPRLPWLTRFDGPPGEIELVSPTTLVLTPVGPVKCDVYLTLPASSAGQTTEFLAVMRFQPLFIPFNTSFGFPEGRPSPLTRLLPFLRPSPWRMDATAMDGLSDELARTINDRWPRAYGIMGTIEGLTKNLGWEADLDNQFLETLAYSRLLAGDRGGALNALRLLESRNLPDVDGIRVSHMRALTASNPSSAVQELGAWRLDHLADQGLADCAAPWYSGIPDD